MGSAALAEYVKRKRDKQLRRNQRKHREEITERRDEEKKLKKISDILWSAHLKDQVRSAAQLSAAGQVGWRSVLVVMTVGLKEEMLEAPSRGNSGLV